MKTRHSSYRGTALSALAVAIPLVGITTGCIDEIEPQNSTITEAQVMSAPGAYDRMVGALTSEIAGQFTYSPSSQYPFDFGLTSFMLARDVMGHDIATKGDWFSYWYKVGGYYRVTSIITQYPWTCYYGWIKNCNTVISNGKGSDDENVRIGLGKAYAMRALFYSDLAQMYARETYALNKESLTVPIVTDELSPDALASNPNATSEAMWAFILEDLDKAEELLAGTSSSDVYSPSLSLAYGLKARAYLITEQWDKAEEYAKKAQEGHSLMGEDEWTSHTTGFNTPTDSWIFAVKFNSDDPNIIENDGDSSWGSQMCIEIDPEESQCGYAANYGQPHLIDRHLYETIPATDFRKNVFVDFAIDDLPDNEAKLEALAPYVDSPDYAKWLLYFTGGKSNNWGKVGGLELKFRTAGGAAGRKNQKQGFCVSVPLMRAEEMKLIEIEAAGRQEESRGIALLTEFATSRDANWTYGSHNEPYGNLATSAFVNEVWWQRRVELWGEGFATNDIKRLNKSVIRSYPNTNHTEGYRWNTDGPAPWMSLTICQTETNYNSACVSNPVPSAPTQDSQEFVF